MLSLPTGRSRLFPIIGDPIEYVESPSTLTQTFSGRGHDAFCVPLQIPQGCLATCMNALVEIPNVDGVLVTMPHKGAAFAYCATTSERAQRLKVVSVMRRNADGTWHGDMLDGLAFVKAQQQRGATVEGSRALLVGAGSAGSAIAVALLEAGVDKLAIHDTDESRVNDLIYLIGSMGTKRVVPGSSDPSGYDLVFNATPLGMGEGDPLAVDVAQLTPSMFVGDVVAGHGTTPLIAAARKAGCDTATGSDMVMAVQDLMADFLLDT